MKRIFLVLLFVVLVAVGSTFAALNTDPVELNYYLGQLSAPLSVIALLFIVVGALLGVVTTFGMVLRAKREQVELRRKIKLREQEIRNLRQIPIKDRH